MVIFLFNLYIYGIHLKTVLYPEQCYNKQCYKEVHVYIYNVSWLECCSLLKYLANLQFYLEKKKYTYMY